MSKIKKNRLQRLQEASEAIRQTPAQEGDHVGYVSPMFVGTCIPSKFTQPCKGSQPIFYERQNGKNKLRITNVSPHGGLPHGIIARLLIIEITTYCVKQNNPEINLGNSIQGLLKKFGKHGNGYYQDQVLEQAKRLLRTAFWFGTTEDSIEDDEFLKFPALGSVKIHEWIFSDSYKGKRVPSFRIDQEMFERLRTSAIPVDLRAVYALSYSTLTLDLYPWLTHKAFSFQSGRVTPFVIGDRSLAGQIGSSYSEATEFKRHVKQAILEIQIVYPEIKVEYIPGRLRILPSATHIRAKYD